MTNTGTRSLIQLARAGVGAALLACMATAAMAQPASGAAPGGPGMMQHGGPGMMHHGGPGMMGHGGPGMRGGDGPGKHGGMHGEGGMMGMHGGDGHRIERMLHAAGASPEQRTKVHQIMKAAHEDMRKQHEAGRALRQQMAQLMMAPKIDPAAVEAQRQKMSAHHDAVSKRMTQAMLEAGAVLTPEQRAKMADTMKARKDMMERHRRERESMDPARRP